MAAEELSRGLEAEAIVHALTGAAAGALVAPFVTAVPMTEVWLSSRTAPTDAAKAIDAEVVETGGNIIFLQAKSDAPLMFRRQLGSIWTVSPIRLFLDLRRDPRRGREQADHLRQEVIGF